MINNWDITQTNMDRLSKAMPEVALLPIGAIEPHNFHLPEGMDFFHADYVAKESCRMAWEKCESVLCLPAVPFGVDCNLMDFPMAIHVSQSTLDAFVTDIVKSIRHYGIRKIVLINGHGGNNFDPLVRQLQCDLDVHVFLCDWWKVGHDKYHEIFEKPDDHAGEFETSIALALFPELVEYKKAKKALPKSFRFEALKKNWVRTSRRFSKLNDFCAVGDPADASAEKGKQYLSLVCQRIADFLVELAQSPIDETFPHGEIFQNVENRK